MEDLALISQKGLGSNFMGIGEKESDEIRSKWIDRIVKKLLISIKS